MKVTFPDDYSVERLKGQAAEFEVKVKEVKAPVDSPPDDALAERLGMGDLEALKNALKVNLESQYAGQTRMKLKRALLDKLDTAARLPAAAAHGRGRVRRHLEPGRGREGTRRAGARGRRQVATRS